MRNNIPILLMALVILTSNLLFAQSITVNTAKEIARNHIQAIEKGNLKSTHIKPIKYQLSSVAIDIENKDTLYFVINDTINKGFVIVVNDKRSWPILGYSLEGNFDEANQPPAFVAWMENRKQEIAYIKKNNLQADSKTTQQWENLSSSNYTEAATTVGPLLQTTWNQDTYYNSLCPSDAKGPDGHALTGCVATSMAQVMKYWNYPNTGTGSHSYTPAGHPEYGIQSVDFGATTYDWAAMPNNVTNQNDAVATLIYHCGVAVDMDYGPDGSNAGMSPTPLENYFNYSSDATYINKSSNTESEWINLLKFELDSHRPIWYRGDGSDGGHAFVCDGYQNTDYFHFNWGWGGYADNYFYLSNLNPGGSAFTSNQAAVIKIFPAKVPDAIGAITGLTEVCAGQTVVTYSVPAIQNATSYIWTLPTGATGASTTNAITVTFGANSGTIKVKAQNSLGTTTESLLAITVNPMPAKPGAISGKTMVCPSVSETYSITPVSGAVNYTWELPKGWTGSSNSASITVTTGSVGGTIKVNANNTKCSGTSSSLVVSIGTPTSPTSVSASLTTVTPGQSTTLQINGGVLNSAPNWIWYTGSCGDTQVGTGSTLTVSPIATTTYYVQATGCGISTTCKSITITYCSAPEAPSSSSASIGSPANGTSHKINFSIPTVTGADGYMWDYSLDGVTWVVNWYDTSCSGTCYSYTDFGDKPNIPIYFRVRAYKCAPKQYSNYTYTLPKPIYTACDVAASPTINGATSTSLNLTLNAETPVANPAATTYSIYCTTTSQYLQSNGTLGSTQVFQTKSAWGTKTVTGLTDNTQYCFYAKAKNSDGDIRYSAVNAACGTTTAGACTTPGTPVSATGSATGQTTANLTWSAGSPAGSAAVTYYWVVGTSAAVAYGSGIAEGNTTGTSASVTGLSPNSTYYLRVYAKTSCDGTSSDYGTSSTFATNSSCISPVVTTQPINQNKIVSESASFSITATGSNNLYQWQVKTSTADWGNTGDGGSFTGSNTPILTISNVLAWMNGSMFRCIISSSCSSTIETSNSATLAVSTGCTAPTTQSSAVSFSGIIANSMTANWTSGNGSRRIVKVNTSNSFTAPANGTDPSANTSYSGSGEQVVYNGNSNSVTVTGLTAGTTYWFRVYEANCTGSSSLYNTNTSTNNPNSQSTIGSEPTCTNWEVTPSSQSVPSTGGSYQASVSASGNCSYNLTFNDSWIHFVNYDGNGGFNYSVDANTSSNSRTGNISINNITDQINNIVTLTVTQTGGTNYTISLSSNPTAGGTTSGGGAFQGGLSKTVIATPANGYTFSDWTENGSVVSTSASYTFTLNVNRSLVANFIQNTPNYTISLSSNPSVGGTTSGGGAFQGGLSKTVIATPANDYTFSDWTENGSVVSTSASYTFTLNANRTLVANFTQQSTSCTNWAATPSAQSVPSTGGTYQATVSASGTCSYSRTFNDTWIHFSSSDENGTFTYSVDPNSSSSPRTGTISINDATSGLNNVVTLTITQAGTTCSAPTSVVVTGGGEYCGNATIRASGGEGGTIYWQGTTYNGTNLGTPSSIQNVKLSGTYYFRAYNSCGWGQQGSVTVIISQSVTPSVSIVAFPTATISPGQLVTFTASSVNGGSSPGYQWNINGVIVGDNSPSFSSSTLLDGQVVSCRMTSNDPCSNPAIVSSNAITMKVSFPVGNEVIPLNNNIKVYPNPTAGIINIEGLSDNKKTKIEVFDSIGKKILSKNSSTSMETLDISNYPSGFYLLKIEEQFIKISKQ